MAADISTRRFAAKAHPACPLAAEALGSARDNKNREDVMRRARWMVGLLLFAASVTTSPAQQFPAKPITLVVPYAPGGNVDISTRILQAGIGEALGQPVIVENKPGAGGLIAGDYVARSAPDGTTLFVGSNASILLGPMTMPKPPYRWEQAFEPVSGLAVATNMLLVTPNLPVKNVTELIDYAE